MATSDPTPGKTRQQQKIGTTPPAFPQRPLYGQIRASLPGERPPSRALPHLPRDGSQPPPSATRWQCHGSAGAPSTPGAATHWGGEAPGGPKETGRNANQVCKPPGPPVSTPPQNKSPSPPKSWPGGCANGGRKLPAQGRFSPVVVVVMCPLSKLGDFHRRLSQLPGPITVIMLTAKSFTMCI